MIKMKALRPFGFTGQHEGHVGRGREFMAASDARAKDLETHGLAFRLETQVELATLNKQKHPPENKVVLAGPLPSVGGEIGAESAPSSSAPARPPRQRRSKATAGALDL